MAKTTFSGPVRAGYQGGSQGDLPLSPTRINTGTVISINDGSGAYGFYSRIQPTTGFGSSDYLIPGEAYGVFGRTQSGAPFATTPTTTFNHVAGLAGNFAVIGTYSNNGLMAGVLGIINTNTLSGDAAVMAFMQGDSGTTTARAAYGVAMAQTTAASGFDYGIDLKIQDPVLEGGGPSSVQPYKKANMRLENDVVFMNAAGVPSNGSTGANFAGKGSLYVDISSGILYINTNTLASPTWVVVGSQS